MKPIKNMDWDGFVKQKNDWIALANIYLINDTSIYLHDKSDNYYFAKVQSVNEESVTIRCFAPKQREGQVLTIFWIEVLNFMRKTK